MIPILITIFLLIPDIYAPKGMYGIYIHDNINDVAMQLMSKYGLIIRPHHLKPYKAMIDPFFILHRMFFMDYNPNEIKLKFLISKGYKRIIQTFYMDFKDYVVDTPDFYFTYEKEKYWIVYKRIKNYKLPKEFLPIISSQLLGITMTFYRNRLYSLKISRKINIMDLIELILQFNRRYGKPIYRTNRKYLWYADEVKISIQSDLPIMLSINNLDIIRAEIGDKPLKITISWQSDELEAEISQYKKNVRKQLAFYLKSYVDKKRAELFEMIKEKRWYKH